MTPLQSCVTLDAHVTSARDARLVRRRHFCVCALSSISFGAQLEAFRRAKAEGTGAKQAKTAAAQSAGTGTATAEAVLPAVAPVTDAAAAGTQPNGDGTRVGTPAAPAAEGQQHAPQRPAEPAPVEGSSAPAAGAPASGPAVPAAVPPAPAAPVRAHTVTPLDGAAAGAGADVVPLPVSEPRQSTAAGAPQRPTWLPPPRPLAAHPDGICSTSTTASEATAASSSQLLPPGDATGLGSAAPQPSVLQPVVPPAAENEHVPATSSADSPSADTAGGTRAAQPPWQPSVSMETSPSSPPPGAQEAAAQAALRASFEASHSPFIALSRTTSGRASSISAAIESASADDTGATSGVDSRRPSASLLAEAASRLSGYSTAGDGERVMSLVH